MTAAGKLLSIYRREGMGGITRRLALYCRRSVTRKTNRPHVRRDFALCIPFNYPVERPAGIKAAAIIHIYYVDLASEILSYLQNVPGQLDVYISTVSPLARDVVRTVFAVYTKGSVDIRVFENRGRDIAAKLVGFRDVYASYDYILSLHTKKSPHGGHELARWRNYLYENLLGSPEIVASIFSIMHKQNVGMVFPQHFYFLQDILEWGESFDQFYEVAQRMGIQIDHKTVLECPSGSMFWCRGDALRPILDLNLQVGDFQKEAGQIDGTLAHAIERAFLFAVEKQGYRWAKVVKSDLYPLPSTVLPINDPSDLPDRLRRVYRPLLHSRSHILQS
ncbi:rhamnan synthesis F family protein [Bordetella flabilis]